MLTSVINHGRLFFVSACMIALVMGCHKKTESTDTTPMKTQTKPRVVTNLSTFNGPGKDKASFAVISPEPSAPPPAPGWTESDDAGNAFQPGCSALYGVNTCTGLFVGAVDICVDGASMSERWSAPNGNCSASYFPGTCKPGVICEAEYYCPGWCQAFGHTTGTCQSVQHTCWGNVVTSAKCVCTDSTTTTNTSTTSDVTSSTSATGSTISTVNSVTTGP